jgi:hypothetical protein
MRTVGLRTYEVDAVDFPIRVDVQAKHLASCRVVASEVQVMRDGNLLGAFSVTLARDSAASKVTYDLPRPGHRAPCDLIQVVHCWFDDASPDNSHYEITISAHSNDKATTTVSRPTINPGVAVLVFQRRSGGRP